MQTREGRKISTVQREISPSKRYIGLQLMTLTGTAKCILKKQCLITKSLDTAAQTLNARSISYSLHSRRHFLHNADSQGMRVMLEELTDEVKAIRGPHCKQQFLCLLSHRSIGMSCQQASNRH